MRRFILLLPLAAILVSILLPSCSGCGESEKDSTETADTRRIQKPYPAISADSAYSYIEKQVSFGPRIPGTASHKKCADWLYAELARFCDTVYYQKGSATTADGKKIPVYNLIGSFKPAAAQRMLLGSHWDSRPWADNDTVRTTEPIDAANDGASGVGVLLDLARVLSANKPPVGVDIIFFDAEDLGKSEVENSFCLGSQYWSATPHIPGYKAQFGVLLDMVGGKDAQFFYENYSYEMAGWVMSHVWGIASEAGFGARFIPTRIGGIIDDHVYVTRGRGIPMIDIIQHDPVKGSFAHYWHTHADNMNSVDKTTLGIVGTVMSALVFNPPFDTIIP